MPLHIGRRTWLGVAVLAVVALGLAWTVFSVETDPLPVARYDAVPTAEVARAERPRASRRQRRRRARRDVDTPPGSPSTMALGQPPDAMSRAMRMPPAIRGGRARRDEMETRLADVAAARGWSADKTAQVRGLLVEALEGAEALVADVADRRQWTRARREVVRFRQSRALEIADALGDEDFGEFVDEMGLSRIPSPTGQPGIRWMPQRVRDVE